MSEDLARWDADEAMRERVERSLEASLIRVPVWFGDAISDGALRRVEADLPLFVALGALTEEEASAWRARFDETERVWRAPEEEIVGDALRIRAAALLERRFDAFVRSEPGSPDALRELQAALAVLRALRMTSAEEHRKWGERIEDAIFERRPEALRPPEDRPYRAAELERVIACPSQRLSGVRLTCLELYRDCAILRWHRVLAAGEARAAVDAQREARDEQALQEVGRRFAASFELRDDLRTRYRAVDPCARTAGWRGISGESGYPVWGASPFVPGVPQGARRLHARNADDEFTIELG